MKLLMAFCGALSNSVAELIWILQMLKHLVSFGPSRKQRAGVVIARLLTVTLQNQFLSLFL